MEINHGKQLIHLNFYFPEGYIEIKISSIAKKMHGVGFEPTRFATPHLECGPLDRSGIRAGQHNPSSLNIYPTLFFIIYSSSSHKNFYLLSEI
jgi:hypothetical protein